MNWLTYASSISLHSNNGVAAKLLIDAGAKVNARDPGGNTPLSLAAALGHCNVVKALLDSPDTDINAQVHSVRLQVCREADLFAPGSVSLPA